MPRARLRAGIVALGCCAACILLLPRAVRGQNPADVRGEVVSADSELGIPNATVEIVGVGRTLTDEVGGFRFSGVPPGLYPLRVTALGHGVWERNLDTRAGAFVRVRLDVQPLELDSLLVELRTVELRGRIRDRTGDVWVGGASIRTSYGHADESGRHGRFRLERVVDGAPVRMLIEAYGLAPLDTIFVPDGETEHRFELERDPVAQHLIERQAVRLDDRSGPRLSASMPALSRDALLPWSGGSLADALRGEYSAYQLGRVRCVLVDERALDPDTEWEILGLYSPWDVERVEVLFDGAMLRVYTREFVKDMIAGRVELVTPSYVGLIRPPVCR